MPDVYRERAEMSSLCTLVVLRIFYYLQQYATCPTFT